MQTLARRGVYALVVDGRGNPWFRVADEVTLPLRVDKRHRRLLLGRSDEARVGERGIEALESLTRKVWRR